MEDKFNLNLISKQTTSQINYYQEYKGYNTVQASSETAENLNIDDVIKFNATLTNDAFDVFDSFLLLEGILQKSADAGVTWAALAGTDNIELELNGFLKLFKEMSIYSSTDRLIERVQYPGEVSTINQFLMRDNTYPDSEGQLNLFVPDTTVDFTSTATQITNVGYLIRTRILPNGVNFQIFIPLDTVFGFFTYVRSSLSNLNFTLELVRDFGSASTRQNVFFGNPAANTIYRSFFSKIRWLIPSTRLNTKSKLNYISQFTKPIHYKFLENRCILTSIPAGAGDYTFSIGNISSNVYEIVVIFKDNVKAYNRINSLYLNTFYSNELRAAVTGSLNKIKVTIGSTDYPAKEYDFTFNSGTNTNQIAYAYKYYLNACTKKYGVNPILNYDDFRKLYTIFYFDLTAQDPSYINLNTPVAITIGRSTTFTATPDMYILLKLEKDVMLDFTQSMGGGAKMSTLELVNIPNNM